MLPPYVVYKAEHLDNRGPHLALNTQYNCTKSGQSNTMHFIDWFQEIAVVSREAARKTFAKLQSYCS